MQPDRLEPIRPLLERVMQNLIQSGIHSHQALLVTDARLQPLWLSLRNVEQCLIAGLVEHDNEQIAKGLLVLKEIIDYHFPAD